MEKIKGRHYKSPVQLDLLTYGNHIPNSSVVVRKSLLNAIGGIDEDREIIATEDFVTWVGIATQTERFVYIPDCLGYYSTGGDKLSSRDITRPVFKAYKKILSAMEGYPEKVMIAARSKLNYYDAVKHIRDGDYESARSSLKPVIGVRFQYFLINIALILSIPRQFLLGLLLKKTILPQNELSPSDSQMQMGPDHIVVPRIETVG